MENAGEASLIFSSHSPEAIFTHTNVIHLFYYASVNLKLKHLPPPGHLTILCARQVRNLMQKVLLGSGEFDLCLGRVGSLSRKCQV